MIINKNVGDGNGFNKGVWRYDFNAILAKRVLSLQQGKLAPAVSKPLREKYHSNKKY